MHLQGKVVRGLGIGKKLGYPTANLECDATACPSPGVYAARAMFDGATHNAAVVIGARHEGGRPLVEVFLLDFKGDLYGKQLSVELLEKISEIEQFSSAEALLKKIKEDVEKVKEYVYRDH